ncbi:DUF4430 domain-containing protein [Levilactobacillus enshiensis]|uniref:DUF4430 domain-containing protein n=1 Tax=Levilactobacillus enshiensis TaxID=2590213 RepID=UPI001179906F|nr:DUF4430 domain-containing protein [Levilactobacillus enshiensis]
MKKSVWIIVAVVVTIFTMGTALAMQQHAQQSTAPQTNSSSRQRSSASQSSASSSSQAAKVVSKKEAHQKSSSAKRKASSKARTRTTKKAKRTTKQAASAASVKAKQVAPTRSAKKTAKVTKPTTKRQAATTTKKSSSKSQSTGKVHLTVTGYKKTFFNDSVAISKNATAFSVLKASKLKLVYQSGVAVYVSSINGLAENDVKVGSGWKYKVNGKFIDEAANAKHVTNGDNVHWYFTTAGY